MKNKTIQSLTSLLVILCLFLCACVPEGSMGETEDTDKGTEQAVTPTESTEAPTERTEELTEGTEAHNENTEAPTERTEVPTESTEVPTESTEAPTESTEAPTESTTDYEAPEESKKPYAFVEGTRMVNQPPTVNFEVDLDEKVIRFPCKKDYGKTTHCIYYENNDAEYDVSFAYHARAHVTPCEEHGDVEITYFLENHGSYEFEIPCHGDLKKEIVFTCEGNDYVLPYSRSYIQDGFTYDVYASDDNSVILCRQTSAFRVSLTNNVILHRPDEITDWESLVAWATAFAVETVDGFSPDAYEFYVSDWNLEKLDFSLAECENNDRIGFGYQRKVGGVATNEFLSFSINTRGDIIAINSTIHGADWSTVTPEIVEKYGRYSGATFTVTAQGIKLYFIYAPPGDNYVVLSKMLEP